MRKYKSCAPRRTPLTRYYVAASIRGAIRRKYLHDPKNLPYYDLWT